MNDSSDKYRYKLQFLITNSDLIFGCGVHFLKEINYIQKLGNSLSEMTGFIITSATIRSR